MPAAAQGPDGVWETPFSLMGEFFQKQKLPSSHVQMGLINLVVLTSARLGNPVVLEVIDDTSAGVPDLTEKCMDLTGDFFWKSFTQMSQEDLISAKEDIKRKTIFGLNSLGFEKEKDDFNRFMANQKLIAQPIITSQKFGNYSPTIEITGPTGCILISKNPKKLILEHPSFLGIHFKPNIQSFYAPDLEEMEKAQQELDRDRIKASLQRLRPIKVEIPFKDMIIQHLKGLNHQSVVGKAEMLLRMLKDITIINNSPPMNPGDFYSRFYNSNPSTVELVRSLPATRKGFLVARKVDHYVLHVLTSGMLRNEEVSFSERERRVFKVVRDYNETALKGSLMSPTATKFEKLAQIARSAFTWPDILKVYELINQDGEEEIGKTGTVYSVLQNLEEKGVIKNAKDPNGRRHGFHITAWELSDTISLPQPSLIEDPVTGMDPIKVRNPISGEIEEI
jgi:hypothetical protein